MERWNIGETWGTASYLILSEKLIEPEFERRSDYDWLREVAAKLGIENEFSQGRDEKAWIEHIWEQTRLAMPDENLPDFATLQKTRQHLFKARHLSPLKTIFAIRKSSVPDAVRENRDLLEAPVRHAASGNPGVIALRSRA